MPNVVTGLQSLTRTSIVENVGPETVHTLHARGLAMIRAKCVKVGRPQCGRDTTTITGCTIKGREDRDIILPHLRK